MTDTATLIEAGLLTRRQIAERFDVSEGTVKRWEEQEGFPVTSIGRKKLYDWNAIVNWIKSKPDGAARKSA